MKYILSLLPLLIVAWVLPSCYPNYGLSSSDYRTVLTLSDSEINFDTLRTYYLVDSVFHINEGNRDTLTREYDDRIISTIASNFDSYGWQRITDTAGSQVPATVVRISATSDTEWGTYWNYWYPWYPGYGGGWWGYPGWGWGGYYPPYWGGGGTYSYSTGSILVQLDQVVVPANPSDSLELRPVWLGSSNGLLSSKQSNNVQRIGFELRQMFDQSPYLNLSQATQE